MKKLLFLIAFLSVSVSASWAQWLKTDRLTSDDTTTSTSLVASHLSTSIGAYQTWSFHGVLYAAADSVTGLKIAIDVPTSATITGGAFGNTTGVTVFKTDPISADATAGAAFVTALAGSGRIVVDATITTVGAGSVTIDFETVTAGKVSIKTGSIWIAQRLQ